MRIAIWAGVIVVVLSGHAYFVRKAVENDRRQQALIDARRAEVMLDENNIAQARMSVSCKTFSDQAERLAVLFVFGQSNAANHGHGTAIGRSGLYSFYHRNGRCYEAMDPLLGSTGSGGSPWVRLGNKLIEQGLYDRILLVPIAVGASRAADWAVGGFLHLRLVGTLDRLSEAGIRVTHFLWHQGEADAAADTGLAAHRDAMVRMIDAIRQRGFQARIYLALASVCDLYDGSHRRSLGEAAIDPQTFAKQAGARDRFREQVVGIAKLRPNVVVGPDTDKVDASLRWDGCHFSQVGLERHADMWFSAITGRPLPRDVDTLAKVEIRDNAGELISSRAVGVLGGQDCAQWRSMLLERARTGGFAARGHGFVFNPEGASIVPRCDTR